MSTSNPGHKLAPHQNQFIDRFFSPSSNPAIVLQSDVGLGKSATLVAIASRITAAKPAARILFIVRRLLCEQFSERLQANGATNLIVDRYRFRELISAEKDGAFWPPGVTLLTASFALQDDVLDRVSTTHWELIVIDEIGQMGDARKKALSRIMQSSRKVVIAELADQALTDLVQDAEIVEWRRDKLLSNDEQKPSALSRRQLHEVAYTPTPAELGLLKTVLELRDALNKGPYDTSWHELVHAFRSSHASLESYFRRVRNSDSVISSPPDHPTAVSVEERLSRDAVPSIVDPAVNGVARLVDTGLQQLESTEEDTKLTALLALLNGLKDAATGDRQGRVCIVADDRATIYYLAAAFDTSNIAYTVLHGELTAEECTSSATTVAKSTAALLVERAEYVPDQDAALVSDVVLYSVRGAIILLSRIINHFDRLGRTSPLRVHYLRPPESELLLLGSQLDALRELFAPDGAKQ